MPTLPNDIWLEILVYYPVIEWMRQRLYQLNKNLNELLKNKYLWHEQCKQYGLGDAHDDRWRDLFIVNYEQQRAINIVIEQRKNVFITGGGGVGKSYVIRGIVNRARSLKLSIAVTASTGVAAMQIEGQTLHSFAGIRLGKESVDHLFKSMSATSKVTWNDVSILVIDEISMIDPNYFQKLDQVVRRVRGVFNKPFGGVQIVAVGDFFQLMPVLPNGALTKFCFQLNEWRQCIERVIVLKQVHRQSDTSFVELLNRVRTATPSADDITVLNKRIKADLSSFTSEGIEPTRLFPKRADADLTNNERLKRIQEELVTIESKHGVYRNDPRGKLIQDEYLSYDKYAFDSFVNRCPVGERLDLKIGAQVMLVVNFSFDKGLVNGSRGVITGWKEPKLDFSPNFKRCPIVKFANGSEFAVKPHVWTYTSNKMEFRYSQIPLILAWALTIHRSQGMTVNEAEMDLGANVFAPGQAYVALSRVRSLEGLCLTKFNPKSIVADPLVKKYYRQLERGSVAHKVEKKDTRYPTEKEIKEMAEQFNPPTKGKVNGNLGRPLKRQKINADS